MAPIVTPTPISMTTLTSMVSLLPIYGISAITFVNDADAFTTVNIN